jgi:hypothetical protein
MKSVFCILAMAMFFACATSREIEVDFVDAELVRIDTVFRYPNTYQQVLTWRSTESNVHYVSYTPLSTSYLLGSRMLVMVQK